MLTLVRVFVRAVLFLVLLIPAAVLLAIIGLPVGIVMAILAVPVLIVLAVLGLPVFAVLLVGFALLCATFGVLAAFVSLGVEVLKVAILVLVPLLIIGWIVRRVVGGPARGEWERV